MMRARTHISLRARLVVAFTGVALVVLLLSGIATYALVRRSLEQHALQDMRARSSDLATLVKSGDFAARPVQKLRIGLRADDMQAVFITPAGAVASRPRFQLPSTLRASDIEPTALLANEQVSGRRGSVVFLAIPTQTHVGPSLLVVVATDRVDLNVLHDALPLMLLAGLIVLIGVALGVLGLVLR